MTNGSEAFSPQLKLGVGRSKLEVVPSREWVCVVGNCFMVVDAVCHCLCVVDVIKKTFCLFSVEDFKTTLLLC